MAAWTDPAPLNALLGPTNTGKTYRAIERLLEHESGTIGLPLRLLAREVYDRITARVGENAVALITGEEKRIGARARYFVCTVEAMPTDREVDFVAVDEIQLGTHPQRGHVFTERLLQARGRLETCFMGAETVRPLVQRLLPTARITAHPRLSRLTSAGGWTLRSLPPKSAIVAFSMPRVYELAARVRHAKGGAAVVVGALSPRTRNAQVALYQAGEVDTLVATDAIGMGLNLDLAHVAFADLEKFDGRETRPLELAELAQIAGRAGRYLNDGSFGTLGPLGPLPAHLSQALENHALPPERSLWWRNADLDSSSPDALLASLSRRPPRPELKLVERALDEAVLRHLLTQDEIRRLARGPERLALLWEACQVPDFGHTLVEHHARFVGELFRQLAGPRGVLAEDWIAEAVARLDEPRGDIDTLMLRIELCRTWTYVSHHARWLESPREWQERTQAIEERLSDALHLRLVERFVEPGHTPQARARKRPRRAPTASEVEPRPDHPFAALLAMKHALAPAAPAAPGDDTWVHELVNATHEQIAVDGEGRVSITGTLVAQLVRGAELLRPELKLLLPELVGAGARSRLHRRLVAWTRDFVQDLFAPVRHERNASLSGAARGLVYQLERGLGTIAARPARVQLAALTAADRELLGHAGVVLGRHHVYVRGLLKPERVRHRAALYRAFAGPSTRLPLLSDNSVSLPLEPTIPAAAYVALGFPPAGPRAVRADVLERLEARLQPLRSEGAFELPTELATWLGCSLADAALTVEALGYRRDPDGTFKARRPRRRRGATRRDAA